MDLARFATPLAAFETALRLGSETLRFAERFLVARFGADFFAARFAAGRFLELLRFELDFFAPDLRPPLLRADLRPPLLRADDLRADFFLAADLRPLFLPRFEPPRDDFLAAAMLRAPI